MTRRLTVKQAINLHADVAKRLSRSHARANEMVRRGEHAARDGFPSSSDGGSGGTNISRPTEQTALARPMEDRTGDHIVEWERVLLEMNDLSLRLDGLSSMVMAVEIDERGRKSTIRTCANPNCAEPVLGELRRGRCDACRKYLDRNGMDRTSEMVNRSQEKAS